MNETTRLELDDKIVFQEGDKTKIFYVKQVVVKDFNNPIWRNGFLFGLMTGSALILVVIAGIISPML